MDQRTAQPEPRLVPPKEMFKAAANVAPLDGIAKGQLNTPTYNVELPPEGGVLSWHVGDRYPVKSWPFKEAVFAVDTIKRVVINTLKFINSSPFRYLAVLGAGVFYLLPQTSQRKILRSAIVQFTNYTTDVVFDRWGRMLPFEDENGFQFGLHGVVWEPRYYCDMVREIRRVAMEIAGDDKPNQELVEAICMILEFDDAYRYRLQDGLTDINARTLAKNPAKELTRICNLIISRGANTSSAFANFAKAIPFIFNIPAFRNVLVEFFSKVDLRRLALDEIDQYRCLLWGGYQFRGMTDAHRISLRLMIDSEWQHYENTKTKK